MIFYDVCLDAQQSGCQRIVHGFFQGEGGGKQLRITLMQPGGVYEFPWDAHVVLVGKKEDGTFFEHLCAIENGKALCMPLAEDLSVHGTVECQVMVYDSNDTILFTPEFHLMVAQTIREVQAIKQDTPHIHPNMETLNLLTSEDGKLFFDGHPLDTSTVLTVEIGVGHWELPNSPAGTMAYIIPNREDPYIVTWPPVWLTNPVTGEQYLHDPKLSAGQLWISSGVKWYLLYQHPWSDLDAESGSGTPITKPDVVPLPFDEPVDLMFREDCREVALPVVEGCGTVFSASAHTNGPNPQLFNVYAGNGEFMVTVTFGQDRFIRTTDGIHWADQNGNTVQRPTISGTAISYISFSDEDGVPMYMFSSVDPIESLPESVQLAFRQLCQVVNVSADAMGTIGNADFVEAFKGEVEYNRTYALHLTGDEVNFQLPVNRWDVPGVPDGYATVYLTIDQDMDIGFDADYFVGGEAPSTTAGTHKLIYNFLPNQQISLGSLDLEAAI